MQLHVKAKRKPQTCQSYNRLLDLHLLPALGSRALRAITRAEVSRLHAKMSNTPLAANRMLALLSSLWNWSARRDEVLAANNPASGIDRYPERRCERFLSPEEYGRLGDALRIAETEGIPWQEKERKRSPVENAKRRTVFDPHAVAALRLLALTGARLHEILDAKWNQIDFDRCFLVLTDSKTGKKSICLSPPALTILNGLPRVDGNPYVIAGHREGKPRRDVKRLWSAICKLARLDGVRIHDLRHSAAATGASAGLTEIFGRAC